MKFISNGKATFKKDMLKNNQFHKSYKIYGKDETERGMLCFNWRPSNFNLGFRISIGKSGINIDLDIWFCIGFYYCWSKKKRKEILK